MSFLNTLNLASFFTFGDPFSQHYPFVFFICST